MRQEKKHRKKLGMVLRGWERTLEILNFWRHTCLNMVGSAPVSKQRKACCGNREATICASSDSDAMKMAIAVTLVCVSERACTVWENQRAAREMS